VHRDCVTVAQRTRLDDPRARGQLRCVTGFHWPPTAGRIADLA